jgi:hypothetical protein
VYEALGFLGFRALKAEETNELFRLICGPVVVTASQGEPVYPSRSLFSSDINSSWPAIQNTKAKVSLLISAPRRFSYTRKTLKSSAAHIPFFVSRIA